jgi:hypothetical protein
MVTGKGNAREQSWWCGRASEVSRDGCTDPVILEISLESRAQRSSESEHPPLQLLLYTLPDTPSP